MDIFSSVTHFFKIYPKKIWKVFVIIFLLFHKKNTFLIHLIINCKHMNPNPWNCIFLWIKKQGAKLS